MLPAVLKLWPDKADPVEIGPHGETLIFFLRLLVPGVLLGERLMVQCQGQHDVSPDLPGVKCTIEPSKLHCMMAVEKTMQIEKVVAATVVMLISGLAPIPLVPDTLDLTKSSWLDPVHVLHEIDIHLLAIAHPLRFNLQRLVEQVVVTSDDVDKIADAARCVISAIQVYMDTAGFVSEAARLTKRPHQPLQRVDILAIAQYRAD